MAFLTGKVSEPESTFTGTSSDSVAVFLLVVASKISSVTTEFTSYLTSKQMLSLALKKQIIHSDAVITMIKYLNNISIHA